MSIRGIKMLIHITNEITFREVKEIFDGYGKILMIENISELDKNHKKNHSLKLFIIMFESISDENYWRLIHFGIDFQKEQLNIEPFIFKKLPKIGNRIEEEEEKKVCVYSIPKSYKGRKLKKIFQSEFGDVVEAAFIREKLKNSFNFGFVKFKDKKSAMKAIELRYITVKSLSSGPEGKNKPVMLEIKPFIIKNSVLIERKFMKKHFQNYIKTLNFYSEILPLISKDIMFIPAPKRENYIRSLLKEQRHILKKDLPKLELFFYNKNCLSKEESRENRAIYKALKKNNFIPKNHPSSNIRYNKGNERGYFPNIF